nr:MAG TPA: hypothetical protein [Crassvirales sp.]
MIWMMWKEYYYSLLNILIVEIKMKLNMLILYYLH